MKITTYKPTKKKPGTCTVYVRYLEKDDKKKFKEQCALREVSMIPACIEFMKRSAEMIPLLKIKEGRRTKLDPTLDYTHIHIRPTPLAVRSLFKSVCAKHEVDMIVALTEFMRQSDKFLTMLRLPKTGKGQQ